MSPEMLLQQFDVLADAPNGVHKMRELILQLAVRGKLVPQDSSDEPASVLLEKIAAEKQRLFKEGKIGKPKLMPPVSEDEVPFEVPAGWVVTRLAHVVYDFQNGLAKRNGSEGASIPVLRLADIKSGELSDRDLRSIRLTSAEYEKHRVDRDDVLVVRVNGSADLVGRFVLCREQRQWAYCDHLIRTKAAHPYVDSQYMCLLAGSAFARAHIVANTVSTAGQRTINQRGLGSLPFPLPPLPEQRRIVAKVGELMALCDWMEAQQERRAEARARLNRSALHHLTTAGDDGELAAHWERLRENFHLLYDAPEAVAELRQAVLQLAVRGKLVPQDPSDEPAGVLLERIATEKQRLFKEGKINKPKPVPPISEVEAPFEVPAGWRWARFGDATINRDGERVPVSSEIRAGRQGPYPYYGASGVIDCIDDFLFDKTLLLIGEDGANLLLRSTPIAFFAEGKYWVNNHAHVIDGISIDLLRYVAVFINATDLAPYVTGTAQPKLNQAKLNSIPLALPPLPEQRRIVAKVDELMALCNRLEAQLSQARAKSAHLAASVVHHLSAA